VLSTCVLAVTSRPLVDALSPLVDALRQSGGPDLRTEFICALRVAGGVWGCGRGGVGVSAAGTSINLFTQTIQEHLISSANLIF